MDSGVLHFSQFLWDGSSLKKVWWLRRILEMAGSHFLRARGAEAVFWAACSLCCKAFGRENAHRVASCALLNGADHVLTSVVLD